MGYQIDNFTLNIDLSKEQLYSPLFYLSKIAPQIKGKLYVIDYSAANLKDYFIIDESKNQEFIENTKIIIGKAIFVDDAVKSIKWLKKFLKGLDKNDFILLNGAERLLTYGKESPIFENKFLDSTNSIHFLENENWGSFLDDIDSIYGENQSKISGIITNVYADAVSRNIILKNLEQTNNMSIVSSGDPNQDDEFELLQKELLNKVCQLPLGEAIKELERVKNKIGNKIFYYFSAIAYYKSGDIGKSIEILESQYDSLLNEEKLMLANMYITISYLSRAQEILNELYSKDKYLKNLFPAFLRLYDSDIPQFEEWLKIGMTYDPDNPAVIEMNATKLSNNGDFISAAQEFRRLGLIQNPEFYELVARINDILGQKIEGNQKIIDYIFEYIALFPQLKNEGVIRLSNYFIKIQDSYFLAYKCLEKADLYIGNSRVIDIIKLKFSIMKDELIASKALGKLKPFFKPQDANIIGEHRAIDLIDGIKVLLSERNGYLIWRDFLECQSNDSWNIYAYKFLKLNMKQILETDIEARISLSYIHEVISQEIEEIGDDIISNPYQTSVNLIKLLRAVKTGDFDYQNNFSTFEEFVKTILTPGEVLNDNKLRIICRYYLSIIASGMGRHQDANNYALSILELYSTVEEQNKILSLSIGGLAWGYSQYRLGRHVEGIFCIIASIEYSYLSNEIIPFLEEGVNIVSRYLSDNDSISFLADIDFWQSLGKAVGRYNENLKQFILLKSGVDNKNIEFELVTKIENAEIRGVNWAGDIVNLVALYAKKSEFSKAIKILDKYRKETISLLENRKDIRFEVLYNWAFMYFSNPVGINNFFVALELIEISNKDLQEKRSVSHKEERASIGTQAVNIYRLYIDICSVLSNLVDDENLKNLMESKLQQIIPRLSPRAIIEQKGYYKKERLVQVPDGVEKEYFVRREEYQNLLIHDGGNIELLSEKAKIIEELSQQLKKNHPNYMELESQKELSMVEIQNTIDKNELFFQCILTTMGLLNILISKNDIKLEHKFLDPDKVDLRNFAKIYSESMQLENLKYDEIKDVIKVISENIEENLPDIIEENCIERIYFVPEFDLYMFPLSSYCINNNFIIDKVKSIVNLIDYSSLLHFKNENHICGIVNRIIGNTNDKNLQKIQRWLIKNKKEKFLLLENDSDNIDNLKNISKFGEELNTVAIYTHGVSDPNAYPLEGAKGIAGNKRILKLEDVMDNILEMQNLVLISCRAGSPNYKAVEESYGTWAAIFEKFSGNIILCRWDVSTDMTIELMQEFYTKAIEYGIAMDKALLIAQKKMKEKYFNPQFWSGIEFWIN
ncbi:MAG: CHAT domain-containing protein [Paenibacillaceae bacterium]|nr:CHAT domain-containing protein [Paenibacillaceae bacterium]